MRNTKVREFDTLNRLAKVHLSMDVYNHSMRVVQYVMSNEMIPEEIHDDCIIAAIAHDLLEDSNLEFADIAHLCSTNVANAIKLLTRSGDMSYVTYICDIRSNAVSTCGGQIAYWVKLADMKDHLAQKKTLSDKLKEKYLEALPFLLP